jgi:hypothetical protein
MGLKGRAGTILHRLWVTFAVLALLLALGGTVTSVAFYVHDSDLRDHAVSCLNVTMAKDWAATDRSKLPSGFDWGPAFWDPRWIEPCRLTSWSGPEHASVVGAWSVTTVEYNQNKRVWEPGLPRQREPMVWAGIAWLPFLLLAGLRAWTGWLIRPEPPVVAGES